VTPIAVSRTGVPIRLTDERWSHIVTAHLELARMRDDVLLTISPADRIVAAADGARMAIRTMGS
jgi:hypothetical protein